MNGPRMRLRATSLRWRLALLISGVLLIAIGIAATVQAFEARDLVLSRSRSDAERVATLIARGSLISQRAPATLEQAIGEQMVATGRLAAELVAVGSQAGLSDDELSALFARVVASSEVGEFWITDDHGVVVISNLDVPFAFSPDPEEQPQAFMFSVLLDREPGGPAVVQESREREIDEQVWKYVGVPGVDGSRIVQLGVPASRITELQAAVDATEFVRDVVQGAEQLTLVQVRAVSGEVIAEGRTEVGPAPSERAITAALSRVSPTRTAVVQEDENLVVAVAVVDGSVGLGTVLVSTSMIGAKQAASQVITSGVRIGVIALVIGLGLALAGSQRLVRPVEAVTDAATALAAGSFDPTTLDDVAARDDEIGHLARTFRAMGIEVLEREQALKAQVSALMVEIDHERVERSVSEIVESEFFSDLTARAAELRRRARGEDED